VNKRLAAWNSSPAHFAEAALRGRLARLMEQVERCSTKPGADEVHDLRVAIRRYSQALRVFAPLLAAKPVKAMRKALRPVMRAAASVRDLDVGAERLLKEGLLEHHAAVEQMRAERRLNELALRGRLLLLQSQEPQRFWPVSLRIQTAGQGRKGSSHS